MMILHQQSVDCQKHPRSDISCQFYTVSIPVVSMLINTVVTMSVVVILVQYS